MSNNGYQKDAPEFNPVEASKQIATCAEKLHSMLKAKQATKNSASTREFAIQTIRGMEPLIHQLIKAEFTPFEILSQLEGTLQSIPADDLRCALTYILRGMRSNKKLRMPPTTADPSLASKPTAPHSAAVAQAAKKPDKKTSLPPAKTPALTNASLPSDLPAWADGSDRMVGESDEDYRFRKEIEGPSEARQKFIGEH